MEFFGKKEAELNDLENSQPIYIAKNEKNKGVANQSSNKISMDLLSQQKPDVIFQDNGSMTPKMIQ